MFCVGFVCVYGRGGGGGGVLFFSNQEKFVSVCRIVKVAIFPSPDGACTLYFLTPEVHCI